MALENPQKEYPKEVLGKPIVCRDLKDGADQIVYGDPLLFGLYPLDEFPDPLILPNLKDKIAHSLITWIFFAGLFFIPLLLLADFKFNIIVFIFSIVLFSIPYFLFYGMFFARKNYYNRKALYKWLKSNTLPSRSTHEYFNFWYIRSGFYLIYDGKRWYLSDKDGEVFIYSFADYGLDSYRYKNILSHLKALSIGQNPSF